LFKHFNIFSLLIVICGILISHNTVIAQTKIAILYSELNEKINYSNSISVIDAITAWEIFLMQDKIPYTVIYDDDLESGLDDDFDKLILPSVNFISNEQMEELQKFLAVGKSIICSGSKLLFQESNFDEYRNLETLFGLVRIKPFNMENLGFSHSLTPNHLNQFSTYDDLILQITNKNQVLFCDDADNRQVPCGYILSETDFNSDKSSILSGTVGSGRFLWTGFDLGDVIGGYSDLNAFKKLISNAIRWMDNQPDVYIASFYKGLSAPVIVTLQYNNALELELIDVLQKNNIRPNLIVTPDQKVSKEILDKFSNDEIILEVSESTIFSSNSVKELINNFNRDNEISITSILIEKQFLENVDISMIVNAGINKILSKELAPGLPKFLNKELLLIPYAISENIPISNSVVNFLNYNPKINCDIKTEDELLGKINQIKSEQYNFTSPTELGKWWNLRERITCEIKYISENEIEIWITNKNTISISDLSIFYNSVEKIDKSSLTISLNNSLLEYYFDNSSGGIVIKLENIKPNSSNKIKINFTLL
jgi:hypothetical protein